MLIHRRILLSGLAAALAAPAIIRTPGLLMPVRRVVWPSDDLALTYPGDAYCDAIGMDFYAADPDRLADLLRGMKEWNEAALQVQATGVAVDGPVRIEGIGNGLTVRSGWRVNPGIPSWMRRDDA